MPIVVEHLHTASIQDRQDLEKIYSDAPSELFAPFASAVALIESGLKEGTLIAARFNDRLLGAAHLVRTDRNLLLSHLCVRALTRRRGVAERLVSEAGKMARQIGAELRLRTGASSPEASALANKLGVRLEWLQ
jgi:GNAT superfamily N-acetyltransferase